MQSDSCDYDNTWDFKTDGTLTYADGPTSCDEDNPPFSIPATWSLQNSDTKLILGIGIDEQHYLIQSITATEMVLFTLKTGTDTQNGEKVILRR